MKKLVSLFLCLAMLFSVMSFAAAEEDMTLNIMLPDFFSDSDWVTLEDGNPVLKAIYDATGVKLNITWVPNSGYGEQTTLTLADPNNMPEVMVMQGPRDAIMIQSARAGAFWDLTEYVNDAANYPNLAAGEKTVYDNISIDGKVYGIYRARAYARAGIYYRNDYAAQVGYETAPTTVEEFKDMCLKMAAIDKDTYVFNMCKYVAGTIGIMTVMNGAPYSYGVNAEGKIYPAFEDEAFQDGLDFIRELYAAGGIDPDFMTIESGNWNDAERSDPVKALMRLDCLDNGYRYQEWLEQNKGADAEKPVVTLLTALKDKNGNIQIWPQNIGASGEIVITKAVSAEKLPKVVKFLEWCNSAEGQTLLNCGVEGETYWIQSDGFRYTYPEGEKDNGATYDAKTATIQHSLNQLGMNVNGDLTPATASTPLRDEYNKNLVDNAKYVIANPCLTLESVTNNLMGATLNQEVEDAQVQYIAGKIDLAGLQAVYANWHAQGGDDILAEYQAAYDALK
jgi:putative aldouronate transport system substrate-binding protein